MDRGVLWRVGGWAAIVGGVLLVVDFGVHLLAPVDTFEPVRFAGMPHEVWHLPMMIGTLLVPFGVVAIYLRQAGEAGWLGFVGFVLFTVGLLVGPVYSAIFHSLFLPDVARYLSSAEIEAMLTDPTAAQFIRGLGIQAVGLGLGAILFGVSIIRTRVLPATGGWLLIAGAVLAAGSELALIVRALSVVGFALALVVLGLAVRHPPEESLPAPASEPGG